MKFRMFTDWCGPKKIAVNVDKVLWVEGKDCAGTSIYMANGAVLEVEEDFQTVISRLNTIAE